MRWLSGGWRGARRSPTQTHGGTGVMGANVHESTENAKKRKTGGGGPVLVSRFGGDLRAPVFFPPPIHIAIDNDSPTAPRRPTGDQ